MKKNKEKVNKLLSSKKVKGWRAVFNSYKVLSSYLEKSLIELNCTVPRFQILLHLHGQGPQTPVSLSRILRVSRANITTFLRRLTEDGLIQQTTENGSAKRPAYELTDKGVTFFEEVLPVHLQNVERIMPALPDMVIKELESIPQKVETKG